MTQREQVEYDRKVIRKCCLRIIRSRKSNTTARLKAIAQLASTQPGIYVTSASTVHRARLENAVNDAEIRSIGTLIGSTGSK